MQSLGLSLFGREFILSSAINLRASEKDSLDGKSY